MIVSFILCLLIQLIVIKYAKSSVPIKEALTLHQVKAGISSFGSIGIYVSFSTSILLLFRNKQSLMVLIMVSLFYGIGLLDDILKVKKRSSDGFSTLEKLIIQIFFSVFCVYLINTYFSRNLNYFLSVFYIVALVNAVNITDGLDTLATKCSLGPLVLFFKFPYLREYTFIALGAVLGFYIVNRHPAKIFMGDAGSHFIGSLLAILTLISGNIIIISICFLPFILECLSSLIQIISIRVFNYKVFSIAPFHHALENKGIKEVSITNYFFIFSIICTLISFLVLQFAYEI